MNTRMRGHWWPTVRNDGHAYSLAEAARFLPISEGTLRKMCVRGDVPEAEDLRAVSMGWKLDSNTLVALHAKLCTMAPEEHHGYHGESGGVA